MIGSQTQLIGTVRVCCIKRLEPVSKDMLDRFLVLYPPHNRMIGHCGYSTGQLEARLIPREIEYSSAKPNYYTASQLVQAISEMGYLLGGLSILDQDFESLPRWTHETYLKRLASLECYYLRLNLRFRAKLLKEDEQLITLSCDKAICTRTRMIAKMRGQVGESFSVEATLYVPLENHPKSA
jgi:hypothetical protein